MITTQHTMKPFQTSHYFTLFLLCFLSITTTIPNTRSAALPPLPQLITHGFHFHPQVGSPARKITKSCTYTVTIETSCASPSFTRDQISLAFGDSHGNEVYAKRLDDPRAGTFERCSKDTFKISGPCVEKVCYLNLLRRGSDGWKPGRVTIDGGYVRRVVFDFDVFLPNGVWYGFRVCDSVVVAAEESLSPVVM